MAIFANFLIKKNSSQFSNVKVTLPCLEVPKKQVCYFLKIDVAIITIFIF